MEADWEVEIGGDAPTIEAPWPGFVDLRQHPEQARKLPEAAHFPALADTLIQLNQAKSPIWTAKCDVWQIEGTSELDPDELDAPPESTHSAIACYIDLLPSANRDWSILENTIATARAICPLLHAVPLRCCRIDLLIRQACIALDPDNTAITAYVTACGSTPEEANHTLQAALKVFANVLCGQSTIK